MDIRGSLGTCWQQRAYHFGGSYGGGTQTHPEIGARSFPHLARPAGGGISATPASADFVCWNLSSGCHLWLDRSSLTIRNESFGPPRPRGSGGHFDSEPGGIRTRRSDRGR